MRHIFGVAILCGVLGSSAALNADEPITVSVRPTVAVARGTAQLTIFVERNDDNRELNWEVDGPDYYRSSTAQLDGASAPRSWFFFVKDLPEGTYEVRAMVKRSNNSRSIAQATITVVPGAN